MFVINLIKELSEYPDVDFICNFDNNPVFNVYYVRNVYIKNLLTLSPEILCDDIISKRNTSYDLVNTLITIKPEFKEELLSICDIFTYKTYVFKNDPSLYCEYLYRWFVEIKSSKSFNADINNTIQIIEAECERLDLDIKNVLTNNILENIYDSLTGNSLDKLIKFFGFITTKHRFYTLIDIDADKQKKLLDTIKPYISDKIKQLSKTKYNKLKKNKVYRKYFSEDR